MYGNMLLQFVRLALMTTIKTSDLHNGFDTFDSRIMDLALLIADPFVCVSACVCACVCVCSCVCMFVCVCMCACACVCVCVMLPRYWKSIFERVETQTTNHYFYRLLIQVQVDRIWRNTSWSQAGVMQHVRGLSGGHLWKMEQQDWIVSWKKMRRGKDKLKQRREGLAAHCNHSCPHYIVLSQAITSSDNLKNWSGEPHQIERQSGFGSGTALMPPLWWPI